MSDTSGIGKRIKKARGDKTQLDFADLIGINVNTLRGYESGQRMPGADTILSIADKTGISLDWLLRGDTADVGSCCPHEKGQHIENIEHAKSKLPTVGSPFPSYEDFRTLEKDLRELYREHTDLFQEYSKLARENADLRVAQAKWDSERQSLLLRIKEPGNDPQPSD